MSQLNVDIITGKDGYSAPEFTKGLSVSGVITATTLNQNASGDLDGMRNARFTGVTTSTGLEVPNRFVTNQSGVVITGVTTSTSFSGSLTGNADTATSATTAATVSNAAQPNITSVGTLTGLTVSGNISVGGTITYDDVTSVDSVGIVTARTDLDVNRNVDIAGVSTFKGADFDGGKLLKEKCYINATAWSSNGTFNTDNGMVQYSTANLGGTGTTLNIISGVGINTELQVGDAICCTALTAVNATTAFVNHITIDGNAITESWNGGSAPSKGGSSGVDAYSFTIIKKGNDDYTVIGNQTICS